MAVLLRLKPLMVLKEWWKIFVQVGAQLCILPYTWRKDSGGIQVSTYRFQRIIWHFLTLWSVVENIYLFIISFLALKTFVGSSDINLTDLQNLLTLILHTVSRSAGTNCHCVIKCKEQELVHFENKFRELELQLLANLPDQYSKNSNPGNDIRIDTFCRMYMSICVLICFHPVGPLSAFLKEPDHIRYWLPQLLPTWMNNSIGFRAVLAAFEWYYSLFINYGILFFALQMAHYINRSLNWLYHAKRHWSANDFIQMHGRLKVMNIIFNNAFGNTWLAADCYVSFSHILAMVTLIKCQGDLPPIFTLTAGLAIFVVFLLERSMYGGGGLVCKISDDVIKSYKNKNDQYQRSCIKSLQKLKIYIGRMYYLDPSTALVFMKFIMDSTIDILML